MNLYWSTMLWKETKHRAWLYSMHLLKGLRAFQHNPFPNTWHLFSWNGWCVMWLQLATWNSGAHSWENFFPQRWRSATHSQSEPLCCIFWGVLCYEGCSYLFYRGTNPHFEDVPCSRFTFDIYYPIRYFIKYVPMYWLKWHLWTEFSHYPVIKGICNNEQASFHAFSLHVFEVDPKLCDPLRTHMHIYQI